jgi:hypothetical protein
LSSPALSAHETLVKPSERYRSCYLTIIEVYNNSRERGLTDTRQQGQHKRKEWLADFATRSAVVGWTKNAIRSQALSEVTKAEIVGHFKSEKAIENAVGDGVVAAHPDGALLSAHTGKHIENPYAE